MPASAYAVVALFAAVSAISGAIAASSIGPKRWWAAVLPALAAFGSLYVVGHRLVISIGPEVELFGFRISLLFDAAVALAVALGTGVLQAGLLSLLQPNERRARRDGVA